MNSSIQGGLSKLKKKHFRVKHQKVKLFRANEPLLSVFMWGVNHTVSIYFLYCPRSNNFVALCLHRYMIFMFQINELSHVTIPVMLLPDDFKAYSKIKVDNHLFNK